MPARARGWPPIRSAAASGRKETTAATLRNAGPKAAGTGLTTSSLRDLLRALLLFEPGPRTRGQAQDADESFRVFLIVALAHGEGREVGAVEREFRLTPANADVAFVELERHRAGDLLLCLGDKRVESLAQRREPQAEIDDLRVLEG